MIEGLILILLASVAWLVYCDAFEIKVYKKRKPKKPVYGNANGHIGSMEH